MVHCREIARLAIQAACELRQQPREVRRAIGPDGSVIYRLALATPTDGRWFGWSPMRHLRTTSLRIGDLGGSASSRAINSRGAAVTAVAGHLEHGQVGEQGGDLAEGDNP